MNMEATCLIRLQMDLELQGGQGSGNGIVDGARIAHNNGRRDYFDGNWIMMWLEKKESQSKTLTYSQDLHDLLRLQFQPKSLRQATTW
jgi:hypothetical protein